MTDILYKIVGFIAILHNYFLDLHDKYELYFSDKQLHFVVIGLLGFFLVMVIHPIFAWLARHDHTMIISFVYTFTLILVITFGIEIGQKITHTGAMEFSDIVFGVVGFLLFFSIYAILRFIRRWLLKLFRDKD